jgi:hypothetical protein
MHMFTLPSPNLLHSLNDSPINTIEDIPGKSQTKRNNQIGNTNIYCIFKLNYNIQLRPRKEPKRKKNDDEDQINLDSQKIDKGRKIRSTHSCTQHVFHDIHSPTPLSSSTMRINKSIISLSIRFTPRNHNNTYTNNYQQQTRIKKLNLHKN